MKDGDLWEAFTNIVRCRGPGTVTITEVKGDATEEMVQEGTVTLPDKLGNDRADIAAEKGATVSQLKVHCFGALYSTRHKGYRQLMCRVHARVY